MYPLYLYLYDLSGGRGVTDWASALFCEEAPSTDVFTDGTESALRFPHLRVVDRLPPLYGRMQSVSAILPR